MSYATICTPFVCEILGIGVVFKYINILDTYPTKLIFQFTTILTTKTHLSERPMTKNYTKSCIHLILNMRVMCVIKAFVSNA